MWLKILKQVDNICKTKNRPSWYKAVLCKCDCGNETIIRYVNINKATSCWCLQWYYKHWMSKTRIYKIWDWILQRCNNINNKKYNIYWWRWITYSKKWGEFEWFYEDMKKWYSDELTIDRINSNWNYCKENCRWATIKQQNNNKKDNIIYKDKCINDWSKIVWIKNITIYKRIKRGRDIEKAIFTNVKSS